jgi:hypothetical protein
MNEHQSRRFTGTACYQEHGVPGGHDDDVGARDRARALRLQLGLDVVDLVVAAEAVAREGVPLPCPVPRLEHDGAVAPLCTDAYPSSDHQQARVSCTPRGTRGGA